MSFDLQINIPTNSLLLDEAPRLTEFQSFGPILNAKDSFGWLHVRAGAFFGWTYTINLKVWTLLHPTHLITDRCGVLYNSRIRVATACHIKCYIAKDSMLIGSFNLTAPTIEDCCIVVKEPKLIKAMTKQFKHHWKALA